MKRVLDSISDRALHKLLIIEEDNAEFTIVHQAANRKPHPVEQHMSMEAAHAYWRKLCYAIFYGKTHNEKDARNMADARIAAMC